MRLMMQRIEDFISWLESATDYKDWAPEVKLEVHKALIIYMISDEGDNLDANHHDGKERPN